MAVGMAFSCQSFFKMLLFSISLSLVWGCSQRPAAFTLHNPLVHGAETGMSWPSPPDVSRYAYVGQLTGEGNFVDINGSKRNGVVRFFRWLIGMSEQRDIPVILQRPQGGMVDEMGRVLVTDVSRHAVYVFDRNSSAPEVWEFVKDGLKFSMPIAISGNCSGGYLVSDAVLGLVAVLANDGVGQGLIGEGILKHPTGIAVECHSRRVYVADRKDNDIKVFSLDSGGLLFSFGGFGEVEGRLNAPTYISLGEGDVSVTDTLNSRVQTFDYEGNYVSSFGRRGMFLGDLPRPKGHARDTDGNIYVVESYYDYLLVFNRNGEFLLPIGGSGYELGQFYLPSGVWTDEQNRIYVADTFNGRVVIFQYLGEGNEPDVAEDDSARSGHDGAGH